MCDDRGQIDRWAYPGTGDRASGSTAVHEEPCWMYSVSIQQGVAAELHTYSEVVRQSSYYYYTIWSTCGSTACTCCISTYVYDNFEKLRGRRTVGGSIFKSEPTWSRLTSRRFKLSRENLDTFFPRFYPLSFTFTEHKIVDIFLRHCTQRSAR